MIISKKDEFDEKVQELARFAKAISHPARIAFLQTIAEKEECIRGQMAEGLFFVEINYS